MVFRRRARALLSVKLEKVGPTFSSFDPRPCLSSVTIVERNPFQCLNIVVNNKPGPLVFEFNDLKTNSGV